MGSAVAFFLYETPKVLLLLTLVVFVVGIVRTFFTPERTRRILAGNRESLGNVLAALLGIVTPFCSCSAVPLFIGFVTAGVPLGVTFSFLVSAPMVNEVALVLLFGGAAYANFGPHGGFATDTDSCAGCHRAHTSFSTLGWTDQQGADRLTALLVSNASTMTEFCYACHGADATGKPAVKAPSLVSPEAKKLTDEEGRMRTAHDLIYQTIISIAKSSRFKESKDARKIRNQLMAHLAAHLPPDDPRLKALADFRRIIAA